MSEMPHWLTKQAALSPNKVAIQLTDGTAYSFQELKEQSVSYAKKLSTTVKGNHKKIALLSNNHLEMIKAIHAISYLNAAIVLLNTRLSEAELTYQLEASEADLLIGSEELLKSKQLDIKLPTLSFSEVNQLEEAEYTIPEQINLNDPFTFMFTSGTTGKPKIVVHTYGNHWWSAIGSALNLGVNKEDKWLLTLPIFHVGGFSILMRSVIYGMEVFLMEKYDSKILYQALKEKDITIASIVTLMLKDLFLELGDEPLPPSVRCLLLGGGAVPAGLLSQVKEKQLPLFQSYGMTETSSQIVTLSEEHALIKIGSSGKALFPAQIRIEGMDKSGVGEIVVKGPMVISGYYKNPAANEQTIQDGWFKTGDLGYIDDDGFLYVVERRNDLIISGGENIYPREIENVLLEMKGIDDAAVAGIPNEKWGQVPVAFVVSENTQVSKGEILSHLQRNLAAYKLPRDVCFLKSLPRNASNKVMRHKLREDFLSCM